MAAGPAEMRSVLELRAEAARQACAGCSITLGRAEEIATGWGDRPSAREAQDLALLLFARMAELELIAEDVAKLHARLGLGPPRGGRVR